jgi:hypothetical protein
MLGRREVLRSRKNSHQTSRVVNQDRQMLRADHDDPSAIVEAEKWGCTGVAAAGEAGFFGFRHVDSFPAQDRASEGSDEL